MQLLILACIPRDIGPIEAVWTFIFLEKSTKAYKQCVYDALERFWSV
jgi:hypothetical protein